MLILGIESSCDDTCAAVVKDGREILSNAAATSAAEQNI
ncbi:MAG: tRNA (adenosine(37)-N6)-threonylcarbamoyltransferase complex transferase subunit TsaD, partial [Oscillospiraceae bacterium]